MIIITPYYQFHRENFEYIVTNTRPAGVIVKYRLYKVENNVETALTASVIEVPSGEHDVLEFPEEGIYSIRFYRTDPDTSKIIFIAYNIDITLFHFQFTNLIFRSRTFFSICTIAK